MFLRIKRIYPLPLIRRICPLVMPLVACIAAVTATALVARSRKAQVPVKNLVQLPYIEELKAKAEQGDAQAQCNLAEAYALGKGVVKDDVEKAKWYRNAAYQGNEAAQYALGCAYSHGEGVPKDAIEAVKWWLRSAHQGDLFSAQSSLGCAYYKGEGVAKDQLEAVNGGAKLQSRGIVNHSMIWDMSMSMERACPRTWWRLTSGTT